MIKKLISILLIALSALLLPACADVVSTPDQSAASADTSTTGSFDPYTAENDYHPDEAFFTKQEGVDYGTLITDVTYYSTTAEDDKRFNILLPPGYDENSRYPVMYMIHGWGADYAAHLYEDSYLYLLYGNMLREGLAEPMILVGVDMYTGKLSEKENLSGEEMRAAYDKAVDDIAVDLMPYVESHYAVKTGRENTAVAGVSEGGAKSLCTGFQWLDKFGYIAGIAPDTGVIPTEWYKGTYWNTPYFDAFPQPDENTMPIYLYLTVGSEDPWNIDCTRYYSEVLNDMGVKNRFDYVEGYAHNVEFWKVCMYNYIGKLFR